MFTAAHFSFCPLLKHSQLDLPLFGIGDEALYGLLQFLRYQAKKLVRFGHSWYVESATV
jgi:hypothetical protein